MVSLEVEVEPIQSNPARSIEAPSSPRISFSAEFLDENNFISISPESQNEKVEEKESERARNAAEFEFLSNNNNVSNNEKVLTADELFFEGKLLPFWQMQHLEKLNKINLKAKDGDEEDDEEEGSNNKVEEESRPVNWFVDDDPSPRPPKCTVLWKELLRLKKQRASSSLSPSSSSSSSSSASSIGDIVAVKEGTSSRNKEQQQVKRTKKVLERTRSATIRIRPMINVPIFTHVKSSTLPPLFPLKKGRLER